MRGVLRIFAFVSALILVACAETAPPEEPPIGFEVDAETISDSQNFETITAQESIETDADRLARLADEYTEYSAEPLPELDEKARVDLAAFAERFSGRPVGKRRYRREETSSRLCRRMPGNDFAQFVFLSKGGPKRDPLGLDKNGDGFACGWQP